VQKLRDTIATLEASNQTLNQKYENINQQLLASNNQLLDLRKTIADQQAQLTQAGPANKALVEQMSLLESDRDQLQQNNNDLKNQLAESQSIVQKISEDAAAKEKTISEMEVAHQQLYSRVAGLDKEKAELARLKDALKNQLGMTQSQIEALSMETTAKEKLIRTKEEQLKAMKKAYDELSKQFEREIREKEIKISNLEDKLDIQLLDKILFASGSADVTPDGNRVLKSLATELQKMNGFEIAVTGHTDNKLLRPKLEKIFYDNLGLSVARASAVSRKLRQMGVSPANLSATGYSMYRPVASNDTKEGRQQNRRVEIRLEPLR
jgi:chemotaxis protein MotB